MKYILFLIICLQLLTAKEPIYYGVYANYNFNSYVANFTQLDGFNTCCPGYRDGSGNGISFGLSGRFPITKTDYLGVRLGMNDFSGELARAEQTYINLPNKGKSLGEFTHYIDATIKAITLEPYYSYNLFPKFYLNLGVQLSSIISGNHNSVEKITKPTNTGTFWDETKNESTNSRSRNKTSGEIPNLSSFDLGLTFGVNYELKMNKENTIRLIPELSYRYGITSFVSDNDWKLSNFNIGLNLFYVPIRYDEITNEIYHIDTIQKVKDFIKSSFISLGITNSKIEQKIEGQNKIITNSYFRTDTLFIVGKEAIIDHPKETEKDVFEDVAVNVDLVAMNNAVQKELEQIKLKIELTKEVYPLLPIIFFEEKSSEIPNRYERVSNPEEFNLENVEPNPINYNRNTLNIIGQRMIENSSVSIEVIGYVDPTTENDCNLAIRRANSIKYYLTSKFNISENRINVINNSTDCTPKDLTKTQSAEGYEENRRVEISSNLPKFLFSGTIAMFEEPVMVDPENILIKVNADKVTSNEKFDETMSFYPKNPNYQYKMLDNWNLTIMQGTTILFNRNGLSQYSEFPFEFSRKNVTELKDNVDLFVELEGVASNGMSNSDIKKYSVIKDTLETEVYKLTLTVFKVSQSTLDNRIKEEIKQFVKNIDMTSKIEVVGYSDDLGSAEVNKSLSAIRAEEVKKYIQSIVPNATFSKVEGVGSERFPPGVKSYLTPEERFISRTVEITLRKQSK